MFFHGPRPYGKAGPAIFSGNALSAAEQVIPQYQTSNNEQNRNDRCRDKKQDCHARSKAEQHKSAHSSHIIPQSLQTI